MADQLQVRPTQEHATIVHGDYKAMNIFLPAAGPGEGCGGGCEQYACDLPQAESGSRELKTPSGTVFEEPHSRRSQCVLIDFASTGVGFGMHFCFSKVRFYSDVAERLYKGP